MGKRLGDHALACFVEVTAIAREPRPEHRDLLAVDLVLLTRSVRPRGLQARQVEDRLARESRPEPLAERRALGAGLLLPELLAERALDARLQSAPSRQQRRRDVQDPDPRPRPADR